MAASAVATPPSRCPQTQPPRRSPLDSRRCRRGHIAAIVTSLEMLGPPVPRPAKPLPDGMALRPLVRPDCETYRDLYRGGRRRLAVVLAPDPVGRGAAGDPRRPAGGDLRAPPGRADLGLLELDFREPETCELAFLGLIPDAVGQGLGRTLVNAAIEKAWSRPIRRFWVHTCTFDHPGALASIAAPASRPARSKSRWPPIPGSPGSCPYFRPARAAAGVTAAPRCFLRTVGMAGRRLRHLPRGSSFPPQP